VRSGLGDATASADPPEHLVARWTVACGGTLKGEELAQVLEGDRLVASINPWDLK
jgi:hypothetical protein